MAGKTILSFFLALLICTAASPVAQAQVKAQSAFGESAISAKYSDAQLSNFVKQTVAMESIKAQYAQQTRTPMPGKYHPNAPKQVVEDKHQAQMDNQYYEMGEYLEENGTTVGAYQAMRMDINRDVVLKKRFRAIARDMGYRNLDVSKDPFKGAPAYVGTY